MTGNEGVRKRAGKIRSLLVGGGCFAVLLVGVVFFLNGGGDETRTEPSTETEGSQLTLACAAAPRPAILKDGRLVYDDISVTLEDVCIVWDPESKTEHFIRRAGFRSESGEFGFLVPTPTKPELAEAGEGLFDRLDGSIRPKYVAVSTTVIKWFLFFPHYGTRPELKAGSAREKSVDVLDRKRVAGYDAAVLAADDPGELNQWLKKNGFSSRPGLEKWLKVYVDQGWIITAFKVVTGQGLRPVRMSFKTEEPFHPYREPEYQRTGEASPRIFRLFFVGPWRAGGTIGKGGTEWPGALEFASPEVSVSELLGDDVPSGTRPETGWLSHYVDRSSPRPGTDELYFSRDAEQSIVKPDPVKYEGETKVILIPLDVILPLVLLGGGYFWIRSRRRRRIHRTG